MSAPEFVKPMETRLASGLPGGDGWQFKPKWDGFRCIAARDGGSAELWGKSGNRWVAIFPR
jgi:ATP-dependent DNA ligase